MADATDAAAASDRAGPGAAAPPPGGKPRGGVALSVAASAAATVAAFFLVSAAMQAVGSLWPGVSIGLALGGLLHVAVGAKVPGPGGRWRRPSR